MSSGEEDYNDGENQSSLSQGPKKRRIQRACDICRRKKSDGVQMPGNRCSNCVSYSYECTYIEAAKKRGPPKGYVESLENRVEKLEKLLRRLCPDEAAFKKLTDSLEKDNWTFERPPVNPSPLVEDLSSGRFKATENSLHTAATIIRGSQEDVNLNVPPDEDDASVTSVLADQVQQMRLDPNQYRFFGKSSGAMLVQTAIDLKNEYQRSDIEISDLRKATLGSKRSEFWQIRPWELDPVVEQPHDYKFPDSDLAPALISLYFECVNLYLPLLHRPTFEREVAERLHLRDSTFASVYLLVCALGARFSDDPRVFLEEYDSSHSAGWKWFEQVPLLRKYLLSPATLHDLQLYGLAVHFLQCTSQPQASWALLGIGIRLAQDVGAHRRKARTQPMSAEDELWKRAFWVLVCMDRMVSASMGRPCAVQDEDFDLDFPIECDDEYWDHPDPEQRFKQPPGKPSLVSAFKLYLKLSQIMGFSLRTIYSINRSKILLGFVGEKWEQHIVAELDSALNKWVDSVPDHLRWDPNREDERFFNQSVFLYTAYYHIQIVIHRPFIPSPSKPSPLSFPSLAICTNAARSCSHVVDIHRRRNCVFPQQLQMSVFTSAIVLLLSIWGGKRSGLSTDPNKEMADVHKCMQVLRHSERRWHSAGRLWDILYELASVGELPLPQQSPPATKRERDSESPISATTPKDTTTPNDGPRNIAGSRRVNQHQRVPSQSQQQHQESVPATAHRDSLLFDQPQQGPSATHTHASSPQSYVLPVYSDDLARLPVHGSFSISAQPVPPAPHTLGMDHNSPDMNYWHSAPPSTAHSSALPDPTSRSNPVPPMARLQNHDHHHHMSPPSQSHHMTDGFSQPTGLSTGGPSYDMDPAATMMMDTLAANMSFSHNSYSLSPPDSHASMSPPRSHSYQGTPMGYQPEVDQLPPPLHAGQQQQYYPSHQHTHSHIHPTLAQSATPDPSTYNYFDNVTMSMLSNAPTGFELEAWGAYLSSFSEMMQQMQVDQLTPRQGD